MTDSICKVCGDPFEARKWWQEYCGESCKRKAERMRRLERDPKRKQRAMTTLDRVAWFAELHDPEPWQIEAVLQGQRAMLALGQTVAPAKLSGALPLTLRGMPNVSLMEHVEEGVRFWTLVADDEVNDPFGLTASEAAETGRKSMTKPTISPSVSVQNESERRKLLEDL